MKILTPDINNSDDDDEVELSVVKKSEASFKYLQDWYSTQYTGDQRPPLVFVIQVSSHFPTIFPLCIRLIIIILITVIAKFRLILQNCQKIKTCRHKDS